SGAAAVDGRCGPADDRRALRAEDQRARRRSRRAAGDRAWARTCARARDRGATPMKNFAMTGVAGFVAPRHLKAISETGNRLVAAVDPHDAVGVLDRYSFDVRFFTEIERFDRHLEKLRRASEDERVHYVSICS